MFFYYLVPTYFDIVAIFRELTPEFLYKRTTGNSWQQICICYNVSLHYWHLIPTWEMVSFYPLFVLCHILLVRLRPLALFFCQINTSKTKWKYGSVHASRFRKEHYILEGFQDSPVCPTGKDKNVDEDEYPAFVELYWQKVTEVLGGKLGLCRFIDHIWTGLGSNLCIRSEMPATVSLSPSVVRDRVWRVLHLKLLFVPLSEQSASLLKEIV
jgi:hypothetical protein